MVDLMANLATKFAGYGQYSEIPCSFPCKQGIQVLETGSIQTASATTHSRATRDFPSAFQKPPMGGLTRARLVSVEGVSESRRCFGAFISARKIPFPGNGDRGSQRPVRYQRLLGQSAEPT